MDMVFMMIALLATMGFLFVVACGKGTDAKADTWKPTAFANTGRTTRL